MAKRKLYTFTLKIGDISMLLEKEGYIKEKPALEIFDEKVLEDGDEDKKVTSITDLLHEKSHKYITVIDPAKGNIKIWISMIDFVQLAFLPISTDMPCWWCRGKFDTTPIGCPIRFCSSNMSKEKKARVVKKLKDANLPEDTTDFFETEGIFCSFPCCKAYVLSKNGNFRYRESCTLLTLLYYKLYGEIVKIRRAGSFHLINTWGGHLTLDEFRASHCNLIYNITPNIKRPFMCATSMMIEEKRVAV